MRYHAQGAQTVGAHLGNDRVSVTSVAPSQTQLVVQMQGVARVLAMGSDGRDRHARPAIVTEKVTRAHNL